MKPTLTLIPALAVAAASMALPAQAQDRITTSVVAEHDDLDLSTTKGQRTLEHRIRRAAREVCGMDEIRTATRIPSSDARACYKLAHQSAMRRYAALIADNQLGG